MFTDKLSKVRKLGRKIVLPAEQIKSIVMNKIPILEGQIIDLGAGTQCWSVELCNMYNQNVYAVDTFYSPDENGKCSYSSGKVGVFTYNDYFDCISNKACAMLWVCDVIHHMDADFRSEFFNSLKMKRIRYIVIKDIDCRHSVGNFMNRLHDLVINRERIHDVNPLKIMKTLEDAGYKTEYFYVPKLWYPHFVLVASVAAG